MQTILMGLALTRFCRNNENLSENYIKSCVHLQICFQLVSLQEQQEELRDRHCNASWWRSTCDNAFNKGESLHVIVLFFEAVVSF